MVAVNLFNKYNSYSAVATELGYPSKNALRAWVREYNTNLDLRRTDTRKKKYNEEQKKSAINQYLNTGRNRSKKLRE